MASSVTVWTSSATNHLESQVARIVRAACDSGSAYDSISVAGCDVDDIKQKLDSAFQRLVTMTMSDSTLHIVAVLPMYEDSSADRIKKLCDACSLIKHSITLHILGLCCGIGKLLDHRYDDAAAEQHQKDCMAQLKSSERNDTFSFSYSLVDEYAANGAPIGFTVGSLSRYIASIQLALLQNYYAILSPALLSTHQGENLSMGVSQVAFDRDAAVDQLLGLGFLAALDNVGINNTEVDLQKATHEAETLLSGISERYAKLYDREIRPLYKDHGVDKGEVVARAAQILDEDINALKSDILGLLKKDTLTFPEKEAVLAMVLGRDNESLRGMQYEHEGLLLDDICHEPIDVYVNAFNRCCSGEKYLPLLSEFHLGTDEEAVNPLPYIKRLKQDILNTTSFLREKQDELIRLQNTVALRDNAEEIRRKWHRPSGDFKNIEFNEQPLDEQYTPAPNLKPNDTVDLRKYFAPARDQLNLGSCTSFAVVSMYEALMNQNGVEGENVMSPAYLYYYSNILKGRPDGGSNYHEQLEVLGKNGVCYDSLYAYNTDAPATTPSRQAEEDAKNHRVIAAKQIPLAHEGDKTEILKHNHKLLTSALSEGYPVGISLKVFDNLGKNGAFVLHPDDAPEAKEDGWHAMVVVGYSEENNFYIVRNSWGQDFGDDGYCYIPTTYIDDPDYMNFACIITEISDGADGRKPEVPTVLANFGATETEIRIATIRNAIAKMRIDLTNCQKRYTNYYKYYQRLLLQLTMPKVQSAIREAAQTHQATHYIDVDSKKQLLEDSFVSKLKEYKKYLIYTILSLFGAALISGVAWYFTRSTMSGIYTIAFGGVGILTWAGYKWWVRLRRRKLQEELDEVAIDARRQAERLREMQIKFHIAGMWISRFHKLATELGNVYDRLVSYNETLRAWQQNYSSSVGQTESPEGQMFRSLDPSPLLEGYFDANKPNIVREIDLLAVFDHYKANVEDLDHSHENLRKTVRSVINNLMADFNIANYLLGDECAFLHPTDLQTEIGALLAVGQPSYRNRAMNATPPVRIVMANVEPGRAAQWETTITPYFPMRPVNLGISDPTSLMVLTIHPQTDENALS